MMENEFDDELDGELDAAEMSPDDYGFILDSDGNLKAVYFPDDMPAVHPKNVKKLLKMFNIQDPGQIDDPTIH